MHRNLAEKSGKRKLLSLVDCHGKGILVSDGLIFRYQLSDFELKRAFSAMSLIRHHLIAFRECIRVVAANRCASFVGLL
ncbi:hypothetical protein HZF05_07135 [Sphingomonas sp. CGMCC 1.13654]|uniref:Uncharacterized protein n=1 Tax=Sphingomonas chungangi TaxID=2683589 RepID=A0A838L3X6_9SPHN|nr:hypothetical protein [Sphingomonas chungangi]MBA2933874.1 hypothetical protein [Sphingomonas chungangi]MVW55204.1 hypothetical protein [Sphingomonas chungangi]